MLMEDYRIQTEIYSGPMELLLYLIRRDEIELQDIPVSHITKQYCDYISALRIIDPNVAGEFLVMATVLMELKSRLLLPRPPVEEGEEEDLTDPRLELVRQLLEYKKYKDASFELQQAAETQSMRWARVPARPRAKDPAEVDLEEVQIWDLVAAFNRVMSSIGAGPVTHDVVFDDTPISLHAADVIDRLEREGGDMTFESIFAGRKKAEMIGLFLALLELMRQTRVRVAQESINAPILVKLLSSEPISIGAEWGSAFEEAVLGPEREAIDRETANIVSPFDPEQDDTEEPMAASKSLSAEAFISGLEFDDDLDSAAVAELDAIKTDVDIESILKSSEPTANKEE
ncbi:MAG: segregation/condensation protein A [Planctomycetes bacterium]|nr:segregation/condensation protein A [Planctomycetota bacterium]